MIVEELVLGCWAVVSLYLGAFHLEKKENSINLKISLKNKKGY
jgi:hypothetical protein